MSFLYNAAAVTHFPIRNVVDALFVTLRQIAVTQTGCLQHSGDARELGPHGAGELLRRRCGGGGGGSGIHGDDGRERDKRLVFKS